MHKGKRNEQELLWQWLEESSEKGKDTQKEREREKTRRSRVWTVCNEWRAKEGGPIQTENWLQILEKNDRVELGSIGNE